MTYTHVSLRDHDPDCRRGLDPTSGYYGLDRERCERCRNLWLRLGLAAVRSRSRAAAIAADELDTNPQLHGWEADDPQSSRIRRV